MYQSSLISIQREKYLLCSSIFEPTYWLCESILSQSDTGTRKRHINDWPDMYQLSLLSIQIQKDLLHLSFFLSLHPCFASLFQSSLIPEPGRDTVTIGMICVSRVYSLQRERKTFFACLFFEPTSSLHRPVLVESKNVTRQVYSNSWPDMYYLCPISQKREKLLLCLYIFDPTSSPCEPILFQSN